MNCLSLRLLVSLAICGWAALGATAARADEPPPAVTQPAEPPLPLTRVVMFSSSVGFFEHRGEIEGDRQIEFAFKTADINDLLKSLVVQDRGGGLVTAVNYGSPEPIARTLRTFAIDLTAGPDAGRNLPAASRPPGARRSARGRDRGDRRRRESPVACRPTRKSRCRC